jgi:hypothetical protein
MFVVLAVKNILIKIIYKDIKGSLSEKPFEIQ